MSAQWYYIDAAGTTLGPVEEKKLVDLWCSNNLKPDSYVWNGTTVNEWKGISDVNFLYTKLKDAKNKRNAPAPRANPPRPAAAARPKKKAGGGARMNLLDSIRSGKKLNKVPKKDLPQEKGPGGSGASRKPAGKMSLQDQLAMKLKKRTTGGGPVKKKTTIPKKTSSGPTWREKQEAKKKAEGGEKKMTWSERQAAKKQAAAASKSSSSGGSSGKAPSKFQLKSKIDACNEDWILMAIDKLLS